MFASFNIDALSCSAAFKMHRTGRGGAGLSPFSSYSPAHSLGRDDASFFSEGPPGLSHRHRQARGATKIQDGGVNATIGDI